KAIILLQYLFIQIEFVRVMDKIAKAHLCRPQGFYCMRTLSPQFRPNRLTWKAATEPLNRGRANISPLLKLIALVLFLPEGLSFYILQFRLSMIRFVLFLLTPVFFIYFG